MARLVRKPRVSPYGEKPIRPIAYIEQGLYSKLVGAFSSSKDKGGSQSVDNRQEAAAPVIYSWPETVL